MLLALAVPLAAAPLIVFFGRRPNVRESVTLIAATILFALVVTLAPQIMDGARPSITLAEPLPGLPLALKLEPLGMLFALIASFLWLVTSVYSIGYMRGHNEQHQTRFYAYFAIALSAVMGVAFAGNLLTLFVFYEILTLSTYPLVTHSGTEQARQAGRLYLGLLLGTSIIFLLLAIVWTWSLAGTLDFRPGGILSGTAPAAALGLLLVLYVFGVGKAALMPFHRWLPAAMVAPTPVSALLHAVAVVKAGVFTVLKVSVYVFGSEVMISLLASQWLQYLAGATILIASLIAMRQDNLKARLAYSTISQLGYVVLGAMLANASGIVGSAMHITTHAFGKITLFFCAGAIMVAAHKTEVSQMAGLGRRMPITMAAFLIASLSIIGLPPTGGTWSKWHLALGTLEAGQLVLLAVLMISSLLNIAYLLPIPIRAFFSPPSDVNASDDVTEAPLACLVAIIITTVGCLALFFYPELFYRLALQIGR
jgi:multicomponent Na+:H+ antiporter subunit D